jgi:lipoyl(octanoyl) transferase
MKIINLGLIEYLDAYEIQKKLNQDIYNGIHEESIIICSHRPVVTLGKKSHKTDLMNWKGKVIEIERGGQSTYHGPSQVIAYPLININQRGNDIYLYLRQLEWAISKTLTVYGINSKGDPNSTGVWCEDKKVASIGIAIKRWITYHGLAINLYNDPMAFKGISPCGMSHNVMTNLEKILSKKVNRSKFESHLADNLTNALSKNNLSICQADSSI